MSEASGSDRITNIVALTQAEYNTLGTPSSSIYYVITDATGSAETIPSGTISGSQQITDFGFISESYSTDGTNILSSSTQISNYNTFLEIENDNVISSSLQITEFGFISESFNATGSGIISSSTQISGYNTFLEILGDNVVSSSQQITDYGFISESFSTDGTEIVSSSTQLENTFLEIVGDNVISSSNQVDYDLIQNVPSGLVSSSDQILPILTSSITNFDTEVSRSVADFGFGSGGSTPSGTISGSQQITDFTFFSSSYTYTNNTGGTINEGSVCIVSGSEIVLADQGSITTAIGTLVIATEVVSNSSTGTFHKLGYYNTSSLTPNSTYYISSSGTITSESAVFQDGDYVRIVGYAISETVLDFNPDQGYIQLGSIGYVSSSQQITDFGFISESYSTDGTGIVSSSAQISSFNTFLEIVGDNVISSSNQVDYDLIQNIPNGLLSGSQQISNFGFISESYTTDGTGIVSASAQLENTFLEIVGDNVISSSNQVDFDSIQNVPNELVSSSAQISSFNTFLEIVGDNVISSSNQVDYNSIQNVPNGLVSSSDQILPILTSSITNFDTEVSRSAEAAGFGSGGGTPSGTISGSQQIEDLNFILSDVSEASGSDQITNIVALTQAEYNALGTPSSSIYYVITDATGSVETIPFGTVSGSQQITDFGFISESYSTDGTGIVSSSAQISSFNTFLEIVGDNVISSSNQVDYDLIQNVPSGLVSSSDQILPILTSSITNFDTEVSRSAEAAGFGSGGGGALITKQYLTASALNSSGTGSLDFSSGSSVDLLLDANINLEVLIDTSSINDTTEYYIYSKASGSNYTVDVTTWKNNFFDTSLNKTTEIHRFKIVEVLGEHIIENMYYL